MSTEYAASRVSHEGATFWLHKSADGKELIIEGARPRNRGQQVTGVNPVFAQQSTREMGRTHRTPRNVMDDATWGAFQGGWTGGVGADADHQRLRSRSAHARRQA